MRVNFLSWHRFLSAISTKKWWATEKTIAYFVADHCVPIHLEVAAAGLTWKGQQMLDSCCNTTKMRSLGHSSPPPPQSQSPIPKIQTPVDTEPSPFPSYTPMYTKGHSQFTDRATRRDETDSFLGLLLAGFIFGMGSRPGHKISMTC